VKLAASTKIDYKYQMNLYYMISPFYRGLGKIAARTTMAKTTTNKQTICIIMSGYDSGVVCVISPNSLAFGAYYVNVVLDTPIYSASGM